MIGAMGDRVLDRVMAEAERIGVDPTDPLRAMIRRG
jgi:hypothetical protein